MMTASGVRWMVNEIIKRGYALLVLALTEFGRYLKP
jgi:hypothetical protein